MSYRTLLLSILLLIFQISFSQNSLIHTFGEPIDTEFALSKYSPDPEATGVVLYERGDYSIDDAGGYIRLIKKVHRKIKVFDSKKFTEATIEIPYYHQDKLKEDVTKITAITHNGQSKNYLSKNAIYDVDEYQNWGTKRFTFPNVQDGSILEYTYTIESPYFSLLGSWFFMNTLPTIYSELHTEIPGNFTYNRTLYGDRKLDTEHAEIKKSCFHLPGFKVPGDCESVTYVMKNVPAFKKEEYMLSPENYMPRIKYELAQTIDLVESRHGYAKTWKELDQLFKNDKNLGKQIRNSSYFKEKLPPSVLSSSDKLDRAKAIYYYIQNHMNWNKWIGIWNKEGVKQAFETQAGTSSEINFALINALEAGGLDAKIMLLATRDKSLPSKQYPVRTDFNYAIALLQIGNEKYFLDASDKYTPFGVLPLRALNVEGRVLDFKKGSYWEPIQPIDKNMHYVNVQMTANSDGLFSGEVKEVSTGYVSVVKRETYNDFTLEDKIKKKQSNNESLDVSELSFENEKDLEKPYKENYHITLHNQPVGSGIFLYPFLMETYFNENPFKKDTRLYPIDFGFPIINNYLISIDLADQYNIVKIPDNKLVRLPEKDGEVSVVYDVVGTKINIRLSLRLNNFAFSADANKSLQEFFEALIKIQREEPIELQKI